MLITLTPQRRDDRLNLHRIGDMLIINGDGLDLSGIPDCAILPRAAVPCDWLAADIERIDGVLHLTLILPIGPNAPHEARFPIPLALTEDGPVALPAYDLETSDAD